MKIYCVGGAVRDELLGLPVKDRDYVVVGATPEEMVREGYKPVGKDFPVFLHPRTHEEYALARTERPMPAEIRREDLVRSALEAQQLPEQRAGVPEQRRAHVHGSAMRTAV